MEDSEIRHERIPVSGGVSLHVARAGRDGAPPVLLLHGFPDNWSTWKKQISPLVRAGFSVWLPDMRGYNLSDKPAGKGAYHLRVLVEDVAAIVRATGHERAHIGGHDWGGIVAWTFAGARPELLDKLVIFNAPHLRLYLEKVWRSPQMLRSWYVLFFLLPALPERVLSSGDFAMVRRMFRQMPARRGAFTGADIQGFVEGLSRPGALTAGLNYYRANARPGATLGMANRAVPVEAQTLVLWGERDLTLGVELLDGLERVAPHARVHRIPAAGHWVHHEAPEEVNAVLVDFLAGSDTVE